MVLRVIVIATLSISISKQPTLSYTFTFDQHSNVLRHDLSSLPVVTLFMYMVLFSARDPAMNDRSRD